MSILRFAEIERPELDPPTTGAVATLVGARTLVEWWQMLAAMLEGHVAANMCWMRSQPTPPVAYELLGLRVGDRGSVVVEGLATALLVQLAPALLTGDVPANCVDVACYICARMRLIRPELSWTVVIEVDRHAHGHAFVIGEGGKAPIILDPLRS